MKKAKPLDPKAMSLDEILDDFTSGETIDKYPNNDKGWKKDLKQALTQWAEKQREDLLHRVADDLSWRIAKGQIDMVSVNLEQIMEALTGGEVGK